MRRFVVCARSQGLAADLQRDPLFAAVQGRNKCLHGFVSLRRLHLETYGWSSLNNPFFTIGHSTLAIDDFVRLLQSCQVTQLVDVRTIPRSRTNPQYNLDVLGGSLEEYQIGYSHLASLGGLRGRQYNAMTSPTGFWRNRSFQNYADYSRTPEFRSGLADLIALGRESVSAVMCAEAAWWRCHRRIIADHLLACGETVFHILGSKAPARASLTSGAMIIDKWVFYPPPTEEVDPAGP